MFIKENKQQLRKPSSKYFDEELIFKMLNECTKKHKKIELLAINRGEVLQLQTQIQQASSADLTFITGQLSDRDSPVNLNVGTKILVQLPQELGSVQFPAELIMISGSPPELLFWVQDYIT